MVRCYFMGIGSKLKQRREALNLTQAELAKIIGVTQAAITNYETEVSHPKEQVLYKLFEALDCDANYLFSDVLNIKTPHPLTKDEEKLLKAFHQLNDTGKAEAVSRIEELTEISKYSFSAQSSADEAI